MDTIRPRNLGLCFDVETTGLPLFSEPSEDPRQPHIVQLGAILFDVNTREELQVLDAIIKPEGWTIPDDVAAIHGITTERALAEGRLADDVLGEFLAMWRSDGGLVRMGFNESFDARLNDTRARSATTADSQGKDAQALLGHASPEMTRRYLRDRATAEVRSPNIRQALDVGQKRK